MKKKYIFIGFFAKLNLKAFAFFVIQGPFLEKFLKFAVYL